MGKQSRKLLGDNAEKVIGLLNRAFADEWLAYYQYWIGAKVIRGPMKDAVSAELIEHATDELRHADMLANRIIQLEAEPILEPKQWYELTNCGYDTPSDSYVEAILQQNIDGERCAISIYDQLMKETQNIDMVTYELVRQILTDEIEHEEDLQALAEDLELMKKRLQGK